MTLCVEFCGVPASGKSSLSSRTVNLLKNSGHQVMDRKAAVDTGLRNRDFGKIGGFIGACNSSWRRDFLGVPHSLNDWHDFVVDNVSYAALVHEWLAHSNADDTWRSCVFYALLTTVFEFSMSRSVGRIVVMDEGFAQRFFTLRGYCGFGQAGDAVRYAETMPLPDILIQINTSPEICLARLRKRTQLPLLLQKEPEDLLLTRLSEGTKLLTELATELEHRGVVVVRVTGDQDAVPIAQMITDCIEIHIPGR